MRFSREVEADVAVAVEAFPWVGGVYALELSELADAHPDALRLAIILSPYRIRELVQTHYALLTATGAYDVTGRVLYVDDSSQPSPLPSSLSSP